MYFFFELVLGSHLEEYQESLVLFLILQTIDSLGVVLQSEVLSNYQK